MTTTARPSPRVALNSFQAAMIGARGSFQLAGARVAAFGEAVRPPAYSLLGLNVQVSPFLLPGPAPSPREDASRIVRHGLADITLHGKPLIGDVGPKPGERTHAMLRVSDRTLMVSPELWERIQLDDAGGFIHHGQPWPFYDDVLQPIHRARVHARFDNVDVVRVTGARP